MPAVVGGSGEWRSRGSRAGVLMLRMRCPPAGRTGRVRSAEGLNRGAREARCEAGVLKCTGFGEPQASEGRGMGESAERRSGGKRAAGESCGGRRAVFRSAGIHSAGCGLTSPVSQSSEGSLATSRLIKGPRLARPPLARRRLGEPPAGRGRRRRRWPRRCGARRRHPARAWRAAAGRAARVLRVRTGAA